jgi:hypothetical protein
VTNLRHSLRSGLDTAAALNAVDEWAAADGDGVNSPREAAVAVDALLGIV